MPKKVLLLNEARIELRDIAAFRKRKVGATSARKITNRILTALNKLADFPNMGCVPTAKMVATAGFRILIIDDYLCFYLVDGEKILVHHIVNGSTSYIKKLFL